MESMTLRDSIVYASFGGLIRIYNLNAPDPTREIGEYKLPFPLYRNRWPGEGIYSTAAHGDFLFLATSNGLAILRITADTALSLVALYDTMIYWHIRSEGKHLFSLEGGSKGYYGDLNLLVMDAGGTVSKAFTWDSINNFTVVDDTILFLARFDQGRYNMEDTCYVYNISDPQNPYLISTFQVDTETANAAFMFSDWSRDRLFLVASIFSEPGYEFFSFDVSDPTSVKRVYKQLYPVWNNRGDAIFDTNRLALGVVSNNYMWWDYLLLDLSSDDSARTLDSMECMAWNAGIRNAWNHEFIVRLYDTLYYFDVSGDSLNIFTKKRLSGVTVADFTRDGRYGYMTLNPDFCLTVIDLWDIDNPKVTARVVDTNIHRCGGIVKKDDRLYISVSDSLVLIYNASDPEYPHEVYRFPEAGGHLEIHGDLLFVVVTQDTLRRIYCYNVSGVVPVRLSEISYSLKGGGELIANDVNGKDSVLYDMVGQSMGDHAYEAWLVISDFRVPTDPKVKEVKIWEPQSPYYPFVGATLRKAVFRDTLYLYSDVSFHIEDNWDDKFYRAKFSISDPGNPVLIDSVNLERAPWETYGKTFIVTHRGLWFPAYSEIFLMKDIMEKDTLGYIRGFPPGYLCSDKNGLIYSKSSGSGLVLIADTADLTPPDTLPNPDLSFFFPAPSVFKDGTRFRFGLNVDAHVKITAYNIVGQAVDVLLDEFLEAGEYVVEWKPDLPSGVYVIGIRTGDEKPMVTVRVVHAR